MKKQSDNTILWWIGWIALTILTFFASSYLWTGFIAAHVGPMDQKGVPLIWVASVFGTWMILLVPLIVLMYNKVDRAYEDSRILKERTAQSARRAASGISFDPISEENRQLAPELVQKLKTMPWTIKRGHLVTASLNDGRRIENVFIVDRQEVVGVYGHDKAPFKSASDIKDLQATDENKLPAFKTDQWLRFDS